MHFKGSSYVPKSWLLNMDLFQGMWFFLFWFKEYQSKIFWITNIIFFRVRNPNEAFWLAAERCVSDGTDLLCFHQNKLRSDDTFQVKKQSKNLKKLAQIIEKRKLN